MLLHQPQLVDLACCALDENFFRSGSEPYCDPAARSTPKIVVVNRTVVRCVEILLLVPVRGCCQERAEAEESFARTAEGRGFLVGVDMQITNGLETF